MDCKIWEETIIPWVNSLGISRTVSRFEQVNRNVIEEIVKIVQTGSDKVLVDFINEAFPNYELNDTSFNTSTALDYLSICTLLMLYICFTNNNALEPIKRMMCSKLEQSIQKHIAEFLKSIQKQGDVFSITSKTITAEIMKFGQLSGSGDGGVSPVNTITKLGDENRMPLTQFFLMEKMKYELDENETQDSYNNSVELKKIKQITDDIVVEELEKTSLYETLKWHELRSDGYGAQLKSRIDELEKLGSDQSLDSDSLQVWDLKNNISQNVEEKLNSCRKSIVLESYMSSFEKESSESVSEKNALLKSVLLKCVQFEEEVRKITALNNELKSRISESEIEFTHLRTVYSETYEDGTFNDYSDNDYSSVKGDESIGVIIEKLLNEKTTEEDSLMKTIKEMKSEKELLINKIILLKSRLTVKISENILIQELNKELMSKSKQFTSAYLELEEVQKKFLTELNLENQTMDDEKFRVLKKCNTTYNVFQSRNDGVVDFKENEKPCSMDETDSKEVYVIYDSSKELVQSVSRLSFDETNKLTTIMESMSEIDCSTNSNSATEIEVNSYEESHVDDLYQEILTAKRSLIAFLRASMKNFEVLKIKENLINEMSKQHEKLECRITSLTELNSRLTKEIMNSKNISEIESEFREKELENLKLEVDSLKNASNRLKEKLTDLEKTNELLVNKKEECLSELALLRERNKSLNMDLQKTVMSQLILQNSCLGFIRNKQETELELEKTMKVKDGIDKRFTRLRRTLADSKTNLEPELNRIEQNFYIISQNLLHVTHACLKWSAKSMERQCYLMGQADEVSEDYSQETELKSEHMDNFENLKNYALQLTTISSELDDFERRLNNEKEEDLSVKKEVQQDGVKEVDRKSLSSKQPSAINLTKSSGEIVPESCEDRSSREDTIIASPSPSSLHVIYAEQSSKTDNSMTVLVSQASLFCSATDLNACQLYNSVLKSASVTSFFSATDSNMEPVDIFFPDEMGDSVRGLCRRVISENFDLIKTESYETTIERAESASELSLKTRAQLEERIRKLERCLYHAKLENDYLRKELEECEKKRRKEIEDIDHNQETLRRGIATRYENELENLKIEMKSLYNRELAKHKTEQLKVAIDLRDQNKMYKEHVEELTKQMWELGEKLIHEQRVKHALERNLEEIRKKFGSISYSTELESLTSRESDGFSRKGKHVDENLPHVTIRRLKSSSFPIISIDDENEELETPCLEDVKIGARSGLVPESQLKNSSCLPFLGGSGRVEALSNSKGGGELKYGLFNFGHESPVLTDSDRSTTKSFLSEYRERRREQIYKKSGFSSSWKHCTPFSLQYSDASYIRRKILKETEISDRLSTSTRIRSIFAMKYTRRNRMNKEEVRRWTLYIAIFSALVVMFGLGSYSFLNQIVLILLF